MRVVRAARDGATAFRAHLAARRDYRTHAHPVSRWPLPPRRALQANKTVGLSLAEVADARLKFGPNALEEKKVNPLLLYLGYFWGPMPVMIWCVRLCGDQWGRGNAPVRGAACTGSQGRSPAHDHHLRLLLLLQDRHHCRARQGHPHRRGCVVTGAGMGEGREVS
jgi:hypothetical protein